jgi:chitodextrinase
LSRFDHGLRSIPARFLFTTLLLGALATTAIATVTIPEGDLSEFNGSCTVSVTESPSSRTLAWTSVPGAASYKVGYRSQDLVGLAETSATTFVHSGFNPDACYEYVVVAYDGAGRRICAGHAPRVGKCP